ncbi:hypothetical protein [Rhizobium sp. NFACC06-2]|uniref:hypothetical protein n=1 Tax=Rhizobium sp. NFACC06-2 TaxID=1566264 RepID=UPI00087744B7|nr:hypothetical protein [Rhizobium sp. NFACC06-2]SCY79791.1 hypothetical protein SAMN03159288_04313 [Rhizobium sp. NFACC06-2]
MTFQDGLQDLVDKPVVYSKYIHGSIFHLLFAANGGEVELVCNGCQWIILGNAGEVLLHDEGVLSNEVLSDVFTSLRLRSHEVLSASLSLHFDGAIFHGFTTEAYHLALHDGVVLGSAEWLKQADAARDSFMLFNPGEDAVGYEFSNYFDLNSAPWRARYLFAREEL